MGRLSDHAEKKYDNYHVMSSKKLFKAFEHKIKKIFVVTLTALDKEVENGNIDKETCKTLRSAILNVSNDQIRNVKKELDQRYNVEFITYHTVIPVVPIKGSEGMGPLFPGSPRLRKGNNEG